MHQRIAWLTEPGWRLIQLLDRADGELCLACAAERLAYHEHTLSVAAAELAARGVVDRDDDYLRLAQAGEDILQAEPEPASAR